MAKLLFACALALALVVSVNADCYLHRMRGSNNRLNEQSANRDNGDRLFDSQNNNKGGYNVGEKTTQPFPQPGNGAADAGPDATYNFNDMTTPMQYQMVYYEGSTIQLEWTNQHACGGNDAFDNQKVNCNMVIQYMCDTDNTIVTDPSLQVILRDGTNTNTPTAPQSYAAAVAGGATYNANIQNGEGHHESEAWYYECSRRSRNRGLFHADQNQNGNSADFTRQNNNGNQRGLECAEERDYYPYWVPAPWIDWVYITDRMDICQNIVLNASQNVADTYKCWMGPGTSNAGPNPTDAQLYPLTQAACEASTPPVAPATTPGPPLGVWTRYPAKGIAAPECYPSMWSRNNHLGNGRYGQAIHKNVTIPKTSDLPWALKYGQKTYNGIVTGFLKCVMRLRYNLSTDDYDTWNINSASDDNNQYGVVSPIQQNPTVDVGAIGDLYGLKLAVNTAQFGRTFQDRSHVFYIAPRPAYTGSAGILNLEVRGKRGNIVQTYPAVEYDFIPNRAYWNADEFIHIQWTGSNTHNNGNPAGDGQAGDAGEGTEGTDRHNWVLMGDQSENYPIPLDKIPNIFTSNQINCWDFYQTSVPALDCAMMLATSGQFRSIAAVTATSVNGWDFQLDNAGASFVGGVVVQITTPGQYNYMCTRNNNFSNRSQKGTIIIQAAGTPIPAWF